MVFDRNTFELERKADTAAQASDHSMQELALRFVIDSDRHNYAYQWTWLGLPIIQLPSDIVMIQEVIWRTKPDLIIETGIAWGGSVALYASVMELIGEGHVIGIDLNLAPNVEQDLKSLPVGHRIDLIKGDSTSNEVLQQVSDAAGSRSKVMVILDSSHTHEHVLRELHSYASLVTLGQYIVVSDTIVEYLPEQEHRPRPWGKGNNPKTALDEFLSQNDEFVIDQDISDRMLETLSPGGYIRRIR